MNADLLKVIKNLQVAIDEALNCTHGDADAQLVEEFDDLIFPMPGKELHPEVLATKLEKLHAKFAPPEE